MGCCWLGKGCKFIEWLTTLFLATIYVTPSFSLMLLLLLGRRTGIRRSDSVGFFNLLGLLCDENIYYLSCIYYRKLSFSESWAP